VTVLAATHLHVNQHDVTQLLRYAETDAFTVTVSFCLEEGQ